MRLIIRIASFLIIFNLISCYDDKGNYDYIKINDIEIKFPEIEWQQITGDTLRVYPKIKYAFNDTTNLNLKYEWSFAERVIGQEKQLEWIIDTSGVSELVLRVTNMDYNLTYMQSTRMEMTSVYTAYDSYLVLSEKNGKSILSFIQYKEKLDKNGNTIKDEFGRTVLDYKVIEDVYYKENSEELGSKPLFVQEHIARIFPSDGHVIVFQEGGQGSVDLDGISMKKDIRLVEAFSGGTYPADFHPVNAEMMVYTHMIENYDGKIYSKIKNTHELFQNGYYIHTPLYFENKEVRGSLINSQRVQDKEFTLLLSKGTPSDPENRLLLIHDYQDHRDEINISGKVVDLPIPKNGWPENFTPLTNLGDSKVLNIGYVPLGDNLEVGYTMFLKKPDGTYQYQYFEIMRDYSSEGLSYMGAEDDAEVLTSSPIISPIPLEKSLFCTIATTQSKYIFFAYGNNIYFMDRDSPENGIRHYYTCKANVVDMNGRARTRAVNQIIVGLDNGGVLILNTKEAKQYDTDAEKFLWESDAKVNLGRIVDVTLKVGGNVS